MGVKVIDRCVETKPCVKPYPKLMKSPSSGHIYLMQNERAGTRIYCNSMYSKDLTLIGEYNPNLISFEFVDYNEPLTLQNE